MKELVPELLEEKEVTTIALQYVRAFKEVAPNLIEDYFSPECIKTGYFYDFENQKWLDLATHNFKELKEWSATYNLENIMPDSDYTTTLLDLQDKIAMVKIEVEWAPRTWGCDYVLLTKNNANWLITNIIWQTII